MNKFSALWRRVRRFLTTLYLATRSREQLLALLEKPKPDTADLLMHAYLKKVTRLQHLAQIVYEEDTFHHSIRMVAGEMIIKIGQENAWTFLPECVWTSVQEGRVVYMIAAAEWLPALRPDLYRAMPKLYSHERQRILEWFPTQGNA